MNLYRSDTNERVDLPATMEDFRGNPVRVECVERASGGGSSGRILTGDGRTFFPGVVRCYIADAPREANTDAA